MCTPYVRSIRNKQIIAITTIQIRSDSVMEPLLATMKCFVDNTSIYELHQTHQILEIDSSLASDLKC